LIAKDYSDFVDMGDGKKAGKKPSTFVCKQVKKPVGVVIFFTLISLPSFFTAESRENDQIWLLNGEVNKTFVIFTPLAEQGFHLATGNFGQRAKNPRLGGVVDGKRLTP
jgi:hypothetical protein